MEISKVVYCSRVGHKFLKFFIGSTIKELCIDGWYTNSFGPAFIHCWCFDTFVPKESCCRTMVVGDLLCIDLPTCAGFIRKAHFRSSGNSHTFLAVKLDCFMSYLLSGSYQCRLDWYKNLDVDQISSGCLVL